MTRSPAIVVQPVPHLEADIPQSLEVWARALADVPQLSDRDVIDVSQSDVPHSINSVVQGGDWRIEVTHGGKRYHWRKGRGKDRQHRPGGKFDVLSEERKAAYRENKHKREQQKAKSSPIVKG